MALIVNADDFGKDESVTSAICEAFEKGLIQRTTLMTNMPFAKEAMDLARKCGFDDRVGIHINLTSGTPLTDGIKKDPVMCNEAGDFSAEFARNKKTRFFLPKDTKRHVESELRAQLDRYAELGGTLWHIDSHHHVHTDPSVYSVLKKVIKDYPVTSIRLSRNMFRGKNPLMRLYKTIFNTSVRKYCRVCPDYFGSAEDYRDFLTDHPDIAKTSEVEVMVHPVYDDNGILSDEYMDRYHKLGKMTED